MKCAKEIMTESVMWYLVDGCNGQINSGFAFGIEKLIIHLVKKYVLEKKAKIGKVEIVIKIDGGKLDSKVAHVSCGFKLTDKASLCPIENKDIYYQLRTLQSDTWCFLVKTIFEKDNQETYEIFFNTEFAFVRRIRAVGIPYTTIWLEKLQN
jgi:hypothetical protein